MKIDREDEMMGRRMVLGAVLLSMACCAGAKEPKAFNPKKFDGLATAALAAMKAKAEELKVGGVAVVNFAPGDAVEGWSSKMAVVGRMKDAPTDTSKGNNLLGVAYAKSAEMADTGVNSGTAKRAPMTGEFGWQGGVVEKVRGGELIVSFSGGKSEEDVQVSKAGLEVMKRGL